MLLAARELSVHETFMLSPDRNDSQGPLTSVVFEAKPSIVEKATERGALTEGVPEGVSNGDAHMTSAIKKRGFARAKNSSSSRWEAICLRTRAQLWRRRCLLRFKTEQNKKQTDGVARDG